MTFNVEYLVAFYMLICIAMTAFNFVFLANERVRSKRFERKMERMAVELGAEIERNADFPTDEHRDVLVRRMRHLSGMEAFDLTMDKLLALDEDKSERYLRGIASVFERLTYRFEKRDDLRCAYFAYIVGRWYRARPASTAVTGALLHFVRERSFYARQNALTALACVGGVDDLLDAIEALETHEDFHHPKLVTEALLAFRGQRRVLSDEAIARFDRFGAVTQAAIVNFVRMEDADALRRRPRASLGKRHRHHRDWAFGLLRDEGVHAEVRLAAERYFMSCPYDPAGAALRGLAQLDNPGRWEFAAVAASVLAAYPDPRTIAVLKQCLSSRIWYVRYNAAKSLHDLGVTAAELADVLSGPDRFAADMVRYRWKLASGGGPA